jgi:hypothetical protein
MRRLALVMSLGLGLLGGCGWGGDGRDHDPAHQPGYVPAHQPGDGRPGVSTGAPVAHRVRGGGDVTAFELVNGADVVRVRIADLGADRFEVSTPDGAKVAPAVEVTGNEVVAGLHDTGEPGPAVVNVLLSPAVRWHVRFAGGAADEAVDLTGGPGGDVDFSTGTSRADVALPAGKGTQRVVLSGGAGQFTVRLAGDEPARVAAHGGAGSVTVDGDTHSGVAGGSVWTPTGWASANDRYDIDATAGVSTLTVVRV